MELWFPKTPEDHIRVFQNGPCKTCMTVKPTIKTQKQLNETKQSRWSKGDLLFLGLHPGLFYYDCPYTQIICGIHNNKMIGRTILWQVSKSKAYYGNIYVNDNYKHRFIDKLNEGFISFESTNYRYADEPFPYKSYKVKGRRVRFKNKIHYVLPIPFSNGDIVEYGVSYNPKNITFVVGRNGKYNAQHYIEDGLQFGGFLSQMDFMPPEWINPFEDDY